MWRPMMTKWIDEARKHIGLKEIVGKDTNLTIKSWLSNLKSWWSEDETPWCGTFAAHCLKTAGYPIPKHWYRALDWLNWGVEITSPCYGCIVVFSRKGGGHVGFVVGRDENYRLMVLGGNQGNAVSIAPFETSRVAGYRMPVGTLGRGVLPTLHSKSASSTNEA
ncbi:MAG: TIGR02594 family protein [Methylotenera sp.]|nr:MAG: TIGR02594 family protein [Methylotenera sp.]